MIEMRTLLFCVLCVGIGFGIAKYRVAAETANIRNILGLKEDMDGSIAKSLEDARQPGKIEVVGGAEFNFGTMKQGSRRAHSFTLKNVGGQPVEIAFKSSTCKCTVGKLKDKMLDPGQETNVELEWYAEKGMKEFAQTATISTSVYGQEEIKLTINGNIGVSYVFSPPTIDFGDALSTETKTVQGRMYSFEELPIDVERGGWSESTLAKYFDVKILSIETVTPGSIADFADARQTMDFEVTLLKGVPPGRFNGEIVFRGTRSTEAQQGFATCAAMGRSVSSISIVGGREFNEETSLLSMGIAESRKGIKKSIILKVKNIDGKPPEVKVREIFLQELDPNVVKVTIGEPKVSDAQSLFPVAIEVPAGTQPCELNGSFSKDFGKIVFETNVETAREYPMFIKFKITE